MNSDSNSGHEKKPLVRKPALKRLCRRAGIKRMDRHTYGEIRRVMDEYLKTVVRHSLVVMRHSKRKTVMAEDVAVVLRNNRTPLFM
jgi:histone H4